MTTYIITYFRGFVKRDMFAQNIQNSPKIFVGLVNLSIDYINEMC